ncbi:Histidine phosphatase superfamily (branch 1) [Marinobacter daqiaonensis]|uniref:Histidine phosphatase superfamily (Branch 1) n=1 Tax=Marinobacter daqiaonensis TaxID=650891 RepID=A0A1I6J9L0_9GAMM|nr:histidine phosphatase family protein [Marinobacter daqiaonensis]SFR75663.1 Histidine phosphatase superfamily (branch 1) [Marinobacter daqiaonensis]
MRGIAVIPVVMFLLAVSVASAGGERNADAWQALRQGQAVLILRHALAPGTGDPAHFQLGDCSTQRNLSQRGREQARAWKPLLAKHGITRARVFTSQWCRSRDTARGMGMGKVTEWPSLNSFFGNRGAADKQTRETRSAVNELQSGLPVILVSHQVNITRLTGVYPSSNEGVIVRLPLSDDPVVLARVTPGP